jgi:hypothetical protein
MRAKLRNRTYAVQGRCEQNFSSVPTAEDDWLLYLAISFSTRVSDGGKEARRAGSRDYEPACKAPQQICVLCHALPSGFGKHSCASP